MPRTRKQVRKKIVRRPRKPRQSLLTRGEGQLTLSWNSGDPVTISFLYDSTRGFRITYAKTDLVLGVLPQLVTINDEMTKLFAALARRFPLA